MHVWCISINQSFKNQYENWQTPAIKSLQILLVVRMLHWETTTWYGVSWSKNYTFSQGGQQQLLHTSQCGWSGRYNTVRPSLPGTRQTQFDRHLSHKVYSSLVLHRRPTQHSIILLTQNSICRSRCGMLWVSLLMPSSIISVVHHLSISRLAVDSYAPSWMAARIYYSAMSWQSWSLHKLQTWLIALLTAPWRVACSVHAVPFISLCSSARRSHAGGRKAVLP